MSEVQGSLQDLFNFKDELLLHQLPPPLLFRLAVVVGKVYRAFSDMNTPVNELVRLVRIYSLPLDQNSFALKRLHEMYNIKKQMLNISIRRLAVVEKKTKYFDREKRVMNWEKLFIKLSEAKGHGRRWKFRMEEFRKKSNEGYEELMRWVKMDSEDTLQEQIKKAIQRKKSAERAEKEKDKKTSAFPSQLTIRKGK